MNEEGVRDQSCIDASGSYRIFGFFEPWVLIPSIVLFLILEWWSLTLIVAIFYFSHALLKRGLSIGRAMELYAYRKTKGVILRKPPRSIFKW